MSRRDDVYKCFACGNIVELVDPKSSKLSCCGEEMKLQEPKTADKTTEKHVPIIEATEQGIKVTVGSTLHPMDEDHFIQWIEVINGDYIQRKYLKPGDAPVAEFYVKYSDKLVAREYCNKHGNWIS